MRYKNLYKGGGSETVRRRQLGGDPEPEGQRLEEPPAEEEKQPPTEKEGQPLTEEEGQDASLQSPQSKQINIKTIKFFDETDNQDDKKINEHYDSIIDNLLYNKRDISSYNLENKISTDYLKKHPESCINFSNNYEFKDFICYCHLFSLDESKTEITAMHNYKLNKNEQDDPKKYYSNLAFVIHNVPLYDNDINKDNYIEKTYFLNLPAYMLFSIRKCSNKHYALIFDGCHFGWIPFENVKFCFEVCQKKLDLLKKLLKEYEQNILYTDNTLFHYHPENNKKSKPSFFLTKNSVGTWRCKPYAETDKYFKNKHGSVLDWLDPRYEGTITRNVDTDKWLDKDHLTKEHFIEIMEKLVRKIKCYLEIPGNPANNKIRILVIGDSINSKWLYLKKNESNSIMNVYNTNEEYEKNKKEFEKKINEKCKVELTFVPTSSDCLYVNDSSILSNAWKNIKHMFGLSELLESSDPSRSSVQDEIKKYDAVLMFCGWTTYEPVEKMFTELNQLFNSNAGSQETQYRNRR